MIALQSKKLKEGDHTEKGAQTQRSNLGQTLKGNLRLLHKHLITDIFTPYYRDIRIVLNNHLSSLRSLILC